MSKQVSHPKASLLSVVEYRILSNSRQWRSMVAAGIIGPAVWLVSMGIGFGRFLGSEDAQDYRADYLAWVAPALLVATALQTAAGEVIWPVLNDFTWRRAFYFMASTELSHRQICAGHIAWLALRTTVNACVFYALMILLGVPFSPGSLLCIPIAVTASLAASLPILATAAAFVRTGVAPFAIFFRVAMLPMFLFSGTFYPLSVFPEFIRQPAQLLPLWHGIELARATVVGGLDTLTVFLHLAVLAAWSLAGYALSQYAFRRRLSGAA